MNVGAVLIAKAAADRYLTAYAGFRIAQAECEEAYRCALQDGVSEEQLRAAQDLVNKAADD